MDSIGVPKPDLPPLTCSLSLPVPCDLLLLLLAEFAPASILLGLSWVSIFFAFQPKAEPISSVVARA